MHCFWRMCMMRCLIGWRLTGQACYIYDIRPGSTMTSSQPAYFDEEHERARVQIERIFRKNEPTQGTFDRMLAVRGANSAHEGPSNSWLSQRKKSAFGNGAA